MMRGLVVGMVAVAACGPTPPPENDTEGGSTGTSGASTSGLPPMTSGGPTNPLPSTDPTLTSAPVPTTEPPTTGVETTTGIETTSPTTPTTITSTTGETATTGEECVEASDCPEDQACIAGACVPVHELPSCPVESMVTSIFPLLHAPTSVVVADLDGDSDLDIATGAPAVSVIEVLTNSGLAEFGPGELVALVPATGNLHLASGDLDGDGDTDLVAAQQVASDINVLMGQGGEWMTLPKLDAASGTRRVFFGDGDGDGVRDLLTISETSPTVATWIGDGLGNFVAGVPVDLPVSLAVRVVDVAGDARSDLVGPTSADGFTSVRVFSRGDGDGFEETAALAAGGVFFSQALAGPLDGAAGHEIVGLTEDDVGRLVAVWRATQPGAWSETPLLTRASTVFTGGLLADFDADGRLDLIAFGQQPALSVLRGDGDGGFACEQVFELVAPTTADLLAVGDVDGDGRVEIVAGAPDLHEIQIVTTL